jgi:hypothetical protein
MGASQPEDGYMFGELVAAWAYAVDDELSMINACADSWHTGGSTDIQCPTCQED